MARFLWETVRELALMLVCGGVVWAAALGVVWLATHG